VNFDHPAQAAELRRYAEDRLRDQSPPGLLAQSLADGQRLLHELQVHQIELEMQNEELRDARSAMDDAMLRYSDFYDFSPTGFISLDNSAAILQINLAAAGMLRTERGMLQGRRLPDFIDRSETGIFNAFLQTVFTSEAKQSCTVALVQTGRPPIYVQVDAMLSLCQKECRAVLVDITDLKRQQALKLTEEATQRIELVREAHRRSGELRTLETSGTQLQNALNAERDVSVAVGITMAQHRIGRDDAFNLLRAASRQQRRRLTDLAKDVVGQMVSRG
jgi:PAS domain-containing protein